MGRSLEAGNRVGRGKRKRGSGISGVGSEGSGSGWRHADCALQMLFAALASFCRGEPAKSKVAPQEKE